MSDLSGKGTVLIVGPWRTSDRSRGRFAQAAAGRRRGARLAFDVSERAPSKRTSREPPRRSSKNPVVAPVRAVANDQQIAGSSRGDRSMRNSAALDFPSSMLAAFAPQPELSNPFVQTVARRVFRIALDVEHVLVDRP